MQVFRAVMGLMAMAVAGQAAPVPPPPEGFAAAQYVDGGGCVWRLEGTEWQPQLDKGGRRVCGFPPTESARRTDPDQDRILALPVTPEPQLTPEQALLAQLSAGLRQGEFIDDPRPPEARRDPDLPAPRDQVTTDLGALARNEAAMRVALAGGADGSSDLCRTLGYRPDPDQLPLLGGDVTRGLCPGMRAPTPQERLIDGAIAAPSAPARAASAVALAGGARDVAGRNEAAPTGRASRDRTAVPVEGNRAAAAPPAAGAVREANAPRALSKPAASGVEMVPASARYVQIGGYRDDDNANIAIRRLSSLGYRVAQTYAQDRGTRLRLVMAGPFADRQALIAALNRLRANGYPKAVAR